MSQFTVLADGLAFPEGPVVMPDGPVVVVELRAGTVRRIWGNARTEVIATPGGGPNGAQLGPDGALYICNNGGIDWVKGCNLDGRDDVGRIERIDLGTGTVERLYDACDGLPLRAPNDLVFDRDGGLWFTDMGKRNARTVDTSAVHYCRVDRAAITAPFRNGLAYNGIGLSPDERTLYVADTHAARLWRFSITAPGILAAAPGGVVHPEWVATGHGDSRFDSLAVTASGAICVGTIRTGGITTITSHGNVTLLPLPDGIVTNIAFGGPDLSTAYITLAGTGRLISMPWSEPGLPLNFGVQPA